MVSLRSYAVGSPRHSMPCDHGRGVPTLLNLKIIFIDVWWTHICDVLYGQKSKGCGQIIHARLGLFFPRRRLVGARPLACVIDEATNITEGGGGWRAIQAANRPYYCCQHPHPPPPPTPSPCTPQTARWTRRVNDALVAPGHAEEPAPLVRCSSLQEE